jgi:hypothetical protein
MASNTVANPPFLSTENLKPIVIRCSACTLNQFMTKSGKCRKCGRLLISQLKLSRRRDNHGHGLLPSTWADSVRVLRKHVARLTQKKLARITGIERCHLSRSENGTQHRISIAMLRRYSRALNVPPTFLAELIEIYNQEIGQ